MPDSLPTSHPTPTNARGQICPKCGDLPTHAAEVEHKGVVRGTYAHGVHIWIVEWAA